MATITYTNCDANIQPKSDTSKLKHNLHLVILADENLSLGARVVAGALLFLFHNTKSGQCFPSNATVGAAVGMAARTVRRHITELVKAGYLIRSRRYNKSSITDFNWTRASDEAIKGIRERLDRTKLAKGYRTKLTGDEDKTDRGMGQNWPLRQVKIGPLTIESNHRNEPLNLTTRGSEESKNGIWNQEEGNDRLADIADLSSSPIDSPITTGDGHDSLNQPSLGSNPSPVASHDSDSLDSLEWMPSTDNDGHSKTPTNIPPLVARGSAQNAFEQFWAVYPRREKKEASWKEFRAAIDNGTHPQTIIEKAGHYARSVVGKESRYITLPSNWLRDKRWTDDLRPTPSQTRDPWTEGLEEARRRFLYGS